MTYFLKLWHNLWFSYILYDVNDILFDIMRYFPYFLMLRFDITFDFMSYFLTSWCTFHTFLWHNAIIDIMTYFLMPWRTLNIMTNFGIFYIKIYFLMSLDPITYILKLWHTFFYVVKYFLTSRRTSWSHNVFFWRYDVLFEKMANNISFDIA